MKSDCDFVHEVFMMNIFKTQILLMPIKSHLVKVADFDNLTWNQIVVLFFFLTARC